MSLRPWSAQERSRCARCGRQRTAQVWSSEVGDNVCYDCAEKLDEAAREATERDPWTGVMLS